MNSSQLKGYLTGLIIGDGTIDKGITKRSFRIKSIHKDFIYKIKEDLENCTNFNIFIRENNEYIDKNNIFHHKNYELVIKSHPYFAKKYHNFYDDYRGRIISKNAINWLNPIGLANWYMSDGYICLVGIKKGKITNRRIDICTDRYSYENIKMICEELYKNFNIKFSPVKRGKFYRIRLRNESYIPFINLIKPFIVPSMIYKLYLGYEKQPKWMNDLDWEFQNSISAIALTNRVEG